MEFHDGPDLGWIISGIPDPFFNRVFRTRLNSNNVAEAIGVTLSHFRSRKASPVWMLEPSATPTNLGEHLRAYGLRYTIEFSGMAAYASRELDKIAVPAGFMIKHVQERKMLEEWVLPYSVGFNISDFRNAYLAIEEELGLDPKSSRQHYVGMLEGEPVASSTLFLGAGVAGIYNVAVNPDMRRKGIGTAMTSICLREARALGYRTVVLHASLMAASVYRRLGFAKCCELQAYMCPMIAPTAD